MLQDLFLGSANFPRFPSVSMESQLSQPTPNRSHPGLVNLRRESVSSIALPMTDVSAPRTQAPTALKQATLEPLVQALQRREPQALEALIQRTEKACFHFALSVLKDRELAKDALQDAYFVVFQKIDQLREPGAFKTWLFRIVNRACHDILRKRKREIETDLSEREELLSGNSGPAPESDPSQQVPKRELLRATFRALPAIDREAIALREVCSLSYEEMARTLSIPIGTVRSRLAKARKRFLQAYRKEQRP